MLSRDIVQILIERLNNLGLNSSIKKVNEVNGGCINKCFQIITDHQHYFLKVNSAKEFPNMFDIERKSLEILNNKANLNVPETFEVFDFNKDQFLLMEWIENATLTNVNWKELAIQLTNLHQVRSESFGLSFDNYIGALKQKNTACKDWNEFFAVYRLKPQIKIARDSSLLSENDLKSFDNLINNLANIFPEEEPVLIHGDLWSGNVLCNSDHDPVFIDPSIYYSNREMEIAFTRLFSGFSDSFYQYYNEILPLNANFKDRINIYNLYPLLVHLNLFGISYLNSIRNTIKKF